MTSLPALDPEVVAVPDEGQAAFYLSAMTTILCIFLKAPQINNCFHNRSAQGLSLTSILLEFWSYMTVVSYSVYSGYPFKLFAEYPFLITQNIFLIALILAYTNRTEWYWFFSIFLMMFVQLIIGLRFVPIWLPSLAINISSPIGLSSKALQLWAIISNQDAGQVSAVTWFLCSLSSLARLLSYIITLWDITLILSLSISTLLNAAVGVAAVVYKKKERVD